MKKLGGYLLLFGIAALLLPLIGLQIKFFNLLGGLQTPVAIASIVIGLLITVFGDRISA